MAIGNKDISTGRDFTLQLNDANGVVAFARLTEWDVKIDYFSPESTAVEDGITRRQSDIKGYNVSFTFERVDDSIDRFVAAQQANFLIDGTQQYFSATETSREKDGTINQYLYSNVDLKITDLGTRKIGEFVMIKGDFFASVRSEAPGN